MSKTRIYAVEAEFHNPAGVVACHFLVEASSIQQAKAHVSAKFIKAEIASPKRIVAFMGRGIAVEQSKADTEFGPPSEAIAE